MDTFDAKKNFGDEERVLLVNVSTFSIVNNFGSKISVARIPAKKTSGG